MQTEIVETGKVSLPVSLNLLLFRIMGVTLAIDTEQVTDMSAISGAQGADEGLILIHEALGCSDREVGYSAPRLLSLRDGDSISGVIIDKPLDFENVPLSNIQPMPEIIERLGGNPAIWGGYTRDGEIVMIVDLYKLHSL